MNLGKYAACACDARKMLLPEKAQDHSFIPPITFALTFNLFNNFIMVASSLTVFLFILPFSLILFQAIFSLKCRTMIFILQFEIQCVSSNQVQHSYLKALEN